MAKPKSGLPTGNSCNCWKSFIVDGETHNCNEPVGHDEGPDSTPHHCRKHDVYDPAVIGSTVIGGVDANKKISVRLLKKVGK